VVEADAGGGERTQTDKLARLFDLGQVEELPVRPDICNCPGSYRATFSNGGTTTWNGMPLAATGNNCMTVNRGTTSELNFGGDSQPLVEARIEDCRRDDGPGNDQLKSNTGL